MPPLKRPGDAAPTACTHEEKAEIFAEKFFPTAEADLSDIPREKEKHENLAAHGAFPMRKSVKPNEVENVIRENKAWKTPGEDLLPISFLKAYGKPVYKALATIAEQSFMMGYVPTRFRSAIVSVIAKGGKTEAEKELAGAYRPIALLNAMNKVIKKIISDRIATAAEYNDLLPERQMGNRRHRSTEMAIRMITEAVHATWRSSGKASLLQLDIAGAFDCVNYKRLLHIMRKKGFPGWTIGWIKAFLTDRKASLRFDNETLKQRSLSAEVPQSSPLSPVLFLLYISTLYEALQSHQVLVVGFADDTNILASSSNVPENCELLERVYSTCEEWSKKHGMKFAPQKSELIHFSRAHKAHTERLRLGEAVIEPTESARFLGVWLDRKLKWQRHLKEIKKKLEKQNFALTRLAASTWGCSSARAKEIYTKVIRSAIAYGAFAWHTPGRKERGKGIITQYYAAQTKCLRVVTGAYKATPIYMVKSETRCPLLNMYLNARVAQFEERLVLSGIGEKIRRVSNTVASRLRREAQNKRRRKGRRRNMGNNGDREEATRSSNGGTINQEILRKWLGDDSPKEAL